MTEPAKRWPLPWGTVLTLALLAGSVTAWLRLQQPADQAAPWDVVASLTLASAAAFLAMRWMQNWFWGVVTAVLFLLHPLHRQWAEPLDLAFRAEALDLGMLAVAIAASLLAYRPNFAWRGWLLLIALGVPMSAGVWHYWFLRPAATLVMPLLAYLLGALVGWFRYRRDGGCPRIGNTLCAFLATQVIFLGGLALASWPHTAEDLPPPDPLGEAAARLLPRLEWTAFDLEQLRQRCWPNPWITVPLLIWGLWCGFRRGWREFDKRQPPTAWLLVLFSALAMAPVVLRPQFAPVVALPFDSLAVLLPVFGIADFFRGISERLVLQPPAEQQN